MKSYRYKLIVFVASVVLFCGCSDFLDLTPNTNVGTTGNFYRNATDIEYAINAIYANLQETEYYGASLIVMTDVRSDDLDSYINSGANAGRDHSIKLFTASSDNQIFSDVWAKIYETIYRCNKVIASLDVVGDDAARKQYEGEARFLRALCYFNIVRLWGAAPLVLEPISPTDAANCIRNSVEDIYSAIEADLTAAGSLPKSYSSDVLGRATSLAAKGLLGKVYLQQKKWPQVVSTLGALIESENGGQHYLLPDIANVFSTAPDQYCTEDELADYTEWSPQTNNSEILFAINYNKEIANEGRSNLSYYYSYTDINDQFKYTSADCLYSVDDRRGMLMRQMTGTRSDNCFIVKYADVASSLGTYGYNFPVLRWSDVLLMYAEAANEVSFDNAGKAFQYLNEVRTRSFASGGYSAMDLPDQASFRRAIYNERRLEFPMEMQRWFDLIRSGEAFDAIKEIGFTIAQKDLLYPIPYTEIALRNDPVNFAQNPGY